MQTAKALQKTKTKLNTKKAQCLVFNDYENVFDSSSYKDFKRTRICDECIELFEFLKKCTITVNTVQIIGSV